MVSACPMEAVLVPAVERHQAATKGALAVHSGVAAARPSHEVVPHRVARKAELAALACPMVGLPVGRGVVHHLVSVRAESAALAQSVARQPAPVACPPDEGMAE